jgi:helicase required for RNAi-mediated heterochromatin assembly 1
MTTAKDNFKAICKFVTVVGRPTIGLQMNPPEIEILFGDPAENEIDPQQEWLLVEARMGYFEAYRHTLVALQRMALERQVPIDSNEGIHLT